MALLPPAGQAQTVEWALSAGGTSNDLATAIAVDTAGNSYVTGGFQGTATFGTFTLTSAGANDVFVAKYDAGGSLLWVRQAGGTSDAAGGGIAVDAVGNSFVTGRFADTATFGSFTLTSAGTNDVFVAKYDAGGDVLWVRSAGGTGGGGGRGITVDAAGSIYVTGGFGGTIIFGAVAVTSAGGGDIFVAKYDSSGNVLWARSAGGISLFDAGFGIGVDAAGNSYVTGTYEDTATFGPFTLTSAGGIDIFVAKYNDIGNVLWVRSAGAISAADGPAISVDATGNSYVTGNYSGTATFGPFILFSAGSSDIFVAKYDTSGNVLWARSAGGTMADAGFGIRVDAAGDSFVTGFFVGPATFGPLTLTDAGGGDIFVAKYDISGNVLWARSAGGTESDAGFGIGVDAVGNSYVTGWYQGTTVTFGPFTLNNAGATDIFVAKYVALVCGNAIVEPGEECDGLDDTFCPEACLSDCTCGPFCGDGFCDPNEDSCNCPDDCGTPVQSEIPGSTCTDRLDNDCDGNADCRDSDCDDDPDCEGVPTVSQWGMALLLVALLAGIALKFRRSRTT